MKQTLLPDLAALRRAAEVVHRVLTPTPQIRWPLLCQRTGAEVWVKHENHTPLGAFKMRGGLLYMEELLRREPNVAAVVAGTRGNHGQSVAFAAQRVGIEAIIVAPRGNNPEKNAAMRALGARLIEHGDDFQEALEHASALAAEGRRHFFPSFHETLVRGVASYALELFESVIDLDAVYVPIGLGSGICGTIAVRDALGLRTEVIGVVAQGAPAFARSLAAGRVVASDTVATIADGMACRVPNPEAFEFIRERVARVVVVTEEEIKAAMRELFTATHNAAEGAGAAPLAALSQERDAMRGRRVALVQSGGNVDRRLFAEVLLEAPRTDHDL